MFHENSGLIASNSVIEECEKSFGQEIIMKSAKLKQYKDDKNIEGNTLSENRRVDSQEKQFVNDDHNADSTKAPDCHPIAKFWQNQIEKAKALDTSNMQCQVGSTYEESYQTLDQIGKGAFGCVKTAIRIQDQKMVVTKFIQKNKIHSSQWKHKISTTVENFKNKLKLGGRNDSLGEENDKKIRFPDEIDILLTLEHPNIIKVLDVHDNDHYFQMVMEHHGKMDLFEFIDLRHRIRYPNLGYREPLESHIFGQIVSAIDYLQNTMHILHRDIKDENVIIDDKFHVKLIDFGSATYYVPISDASSSPEERKLFSTFYGTVEYCAPEVLIGEKYAGPELELWSLGVLLYVLLFGEHPFYDIEETIRCDEVGIKLFFEISSPCLDILSGLLVKNPINRMGMTELVTKPWINQESVVNDQLEGITLNDVLGISNEQNDYFLLK